MGAALLYVSAARRNYCKSKDRDRKGKANHRSADLLSMQRIVSEAQNRFIIKDRFCIFFDESLRVCGQRSTVAGTSLPLSIITCTVCTISSSYSLLKLSLAPSTSLQGYDL